MSKWLSTPQLANLRICESRAFISESSSLIDIAPRPIASTEVDCTLYQHHRLRAITPYSPPHKPSATPLFNFTLQQHSDPSMVHGVLKNKGKLNPQAAEFTLGGQSRQPVSSPSSNGSNGSISKGATTSDESDSSGDSQKTTGPTIAPSAVAVAAAPPHPSFHLQSQPPHSHYHPRGFLVETKPTHRSTEMERSASSSTYESNDTATPQKRNSRPPSPQFDPSSPLLQARYRSQHEEHDDDDASSLSSLSSVYSLLPLRTLRRLHLLQFAFTFVLLFLLPVVLLIIYKREFRFWPFALGITSWLAGEQLREVVVDLCTREKLDKIVSEDGAVELVRRKGTILPAVVHSIAQEILRLGAIYLVVALLPPNPPSPPSPVDIVDAHRSPRQPLPPLDTLFWSAIFLSLGWAFVEIVWGSRGFWKQLDCYEDVLGEEEQDRLVGDEERLEVLEGTRLIERRRHSEDREGSYGTYQNESGLTTTSMGQERDMDEFEARMREMQREEIERTLGVPLYEIPVTVTFIWRLDS